MKSFLIVCLATFAILQANAFGGVRMELNDGIVNGIRDMAAEAFLAPFIGMLQNGPMQLPDPGHIQCPMTGEDMEVRNVVLNSLNVVVEDVTFHFPINNLFRTV